MPKGASGSKRTHRQLGDDTTVEPHKFPPQKTMANPEVLKFATLSEKKLDAKIKRQEKKVEEATILLKRQQRLAKGNSVLIKACRKQCESYKHNLESLKKAKRLLMEQSSRSEDSVETQLARIAEQQAMTKKAAEQQKRQKKIAKVRRDLHTSRAMRPKHVRPQTSKELRWVHATIGASNDTASEETTDKALALFEGRTMTQLDSGDDVDSSDEEEEDDLSSDEDPKDNAELRALTAHAHCAKASKPCATATKCQPQHPDDVPTDSDTEDDEDYEDDIREFSDAINREPDPEERQRLLIRLGINCVCPEGCDASSKVTGSQVHVCDALELPPERLDPRQVVWYVQVRKDWLESEGFPQNNPAMQHIPDYVKLVCFNELNQELEEGTVQPLWCYVRPKPTQEAQCVTPALKEAFPEYYKGVHLRVRETGVVKAYVTPDSWFHATRNDGVKANRLDVLKGSADSKMLKYFQYMIKKAKREQTSETQFVYRTGTIQIFLRELYVPECVFRPLADESNEFATDESNESNEFATDESNESDKDDTELYDELFWDKPLCERLTRATFKTAPCEPDVDVQRYLRYINGVQEKYSKLKPHSLFLKFVPTPAGFVEIELSGTLTELEGVCAQTKHLSERHKEVTKALKQKNVCFNAEQRQRFEAIAAEYEQEHSRLCALKEALQAKRELSYRDIIGLDKAFTEACESATRVVFRSHLSFLHPIV